MKKTLCLVQRAFSFSENGIAQTHVSPGDKPMVPDHLVPGLEAAGYLIRVDLPVEEMSRDQLIDASISMFRIMAAGLTDDQLRGSVFEQRNLIARMAAEAAEDDADPDADEVDFLYGSSILPSIVEVGALRVQLGGLVVATAKYNGFDTKAWNALAEDARETLLAEAVELFSGNEAGALAWIDEATVVERVEPPPVETKIEPPLETGAPIGIEGGEANDTLTATSGADTLIGGQGEDTIVAGPGADDVETIAPLANGGEGFAVDAAAIDEAKAAVAAAVDADADGHDDTTGEFVPGNDAAKKRRARSAAE